MSPTVAARWSRRKVRLPGRHRNCSPAAGPAGSASACHRPPARVLRRVGDARQSAARRPGATAARHPSRRPSPTAPSAAASRRISVPPAELQRHGCPASTRTRPGPIASASTIGREARFITATVRRARAAAMARPCAVMVSPGPSQHHQHHLVLRDDARRRPGRPARRAGSAAIGRRSCRPTTSAACCAVPGRTRSARSRSRAQSSGPTMSPTAEPPRRHHHRHRRSAPGPVTRPRQLGMPSAATTSTAAKRRVPLS